MGGDHNRNTPELIEKMKAPINIMIEMKKKAIEENLAI